MGRFCRDCCVRTSEYSRKKLSVFATTPATMWPAPAMNGFDLPMGPHALAPTAPAAGSHDQLLRSGALLFQLQPGLSLAVQEYAERQQRTNPGWATVPPAPPPQVNVPGSSDLPHDA
jgi:hypothetical protein